MGEVVRAKALDIDMTFAPAQAPELSVSQYDIDGLFCFAFRNNQINFEPLS